MLELLLVAVAAIVVLAPKLLGLNPKEDDVAVERF